jgi:preprotein translocase subunit SecF
MEQISAKFNFPYLKYRWVAGTFSLLLIIGSIFVWIQKGPNKYGLDFSGGSELVVAFEQNVSIDEIRTALQKGGFPSATVQEFGGDIVGGEKNKREFSIRIKSETSQGLSEKFREILTANIPGKTYEILKQDYVGPIIGEQIRKDGIWALCLALLGLLVYVSLRFELRFAVGAIVALAHDVIITTGVFLFVGHELSAGALAALLTIIGYSVNDTIIIFDRIRENLLELTKKSKEKSITIPQLSKIIDDSINQTLSRTIITSLTVFFVVLCLWIFGGGAIEDLSFALVVGVIIGVYSTMFIACPVLLLFSTKAKK